MKKTILLFSILFAVSGIAQVPAGYYDTATGTGYDLKTQLYNIIKDHDYQTYNALRDILYKSDSPINGFRDKYYEQDDTILDIYSENPEGTDPYNYDKDDNCGNYSSEGDCYNREHLIPQSYFGGSNSYPMYSDAFHVWPTDGKVNAWRDNFPFGVVAGSSSNPCNTGATNTPCHSQNGSKKGNNLNSEYSAGYSSTVFEPIDEFKGDIARAFFYFATRYETQMSGFYTSANASTTQTKNMFDGSSDKVFSQTFLNILYQWHIQDPVSQREIDINNLIYDFQGNRNPFIDNSDYVAMIWGDNLSIYEIEPVYVSVYPNPSKDQRINITSDKEIEEIRLINLNGQIIQQINRPNPQNNTYTLENLPSGFYILNLNIDNQNITKKIVVN